DLLADLLDQRIVAAVEPRELHRTREVAQPEEQRLPEGRKVAVIVWPVMERAFRSHRHPCVERSGWSGPVIGNAAKEMKAVTHPDFTRGKPSRRARFHPPRDLTGRTPFP